MYLRAESGAGILVMGEYVEGVTPFHLGGASKRLCISVAAEALRLKIAHRRWAFDQSCRQQFSGLWLTAEMRYAWIKFGGLLILNVWGGFHARRG